MIRLAVRCEPEYAEPVLANLLELAPNGVEEERGPGWVEYAVREIPEIRSVKVDLVFDPPWNPSRMSDEAKLQLNMF